MLSCCDQEQNADVKLLAAPLGCKRFLVEDFGIHYIVMSQLQVASILPIIPLLLARVVWEPYGRLPAYKLLN